MGVGRATPEGKYRRIGMSERGSIAYLPIVYSWVDKTEISCAYHLTSGVLRSSTLPVSESSKGLVVKLLISR
jgi:hypothetical protein